MKSFKQYIKESLLDDEDDIAIDTLPLVKEFLKKNYKFRGQIGIYKGEDDIYIVNGYGIYMENNESEHLTNGLFRFGKCKSFDCSSAWSSFQGVRPQLKSLEGAPQECEEFSCKRCRGLTSLKGAPQKCVTFYCSDCVNLTSLEGCPQECECRLRGLSSRASWRDPEALPLRFHQAWSRSGECLAAR